MAVKLKTPKFDTENDSQEIEGSSTETSTTFHSENPWEHCENSNVHGTLIMKCPKCSWHYYCKIYPICDHEIPEERNYIKEGFLRCHDCGSTTHKNAKTLETRQFLFSILKRRTNLMIYFLSLSNCYIIILLFL